MNEIFNPSSVSPNLSECGSLLPLSIELLKTRHIGLFSKAAASCRKRPAGALNAQH